jgi:hypothetical protein
MTRLLSLIAAALLATSLGFAAHAQDMLDMVDLKSDQFTKAEMSRADIETVNRPGFSGGCLV